MSKKLIINCTTGEKEYRDMTAPEEAAWASRKIVIQSLSNTLKEKEKQGNLKTRVEALEQEIELLKAQ